METCLSFFEILPFGIFVRQKKLYIEKNETNTRKKNAEYLPDLYPRSYDKHFVKSLNKMKKPHKTPPGPVLVIDDILKETQTLLSREIRLTGTPILLKNVINLIRVRV